MGRLLSLQTPHYKLRTSPLHGLDDRRDPHPDANALRREAVALARAPQLVRDRRDETRARRAERMADGDRAAVDVDLVHRDAELFARGDHLRGERLVEF